MDAGTEAFRRKKPGQVGGPLGMPESNRSQMFNNLGVIDLSSETPVNNSRGPVHQPPQGAVPMQSQMYYQQQPLPPQQQQQQQQLQQQQQQQQQQQYGDSMNSPYMPNSQQPLYPNNGGYPLATYQQAPAHVPSKKSAPSGRNTAATVSSGMNKFFKKSWRHNKEDDFADDEGIDMDGEEMTYNDLPHLRMGGRYAETPAKGVESTAPYIPTILSKPVTTQEDVEKLSNTEYRKQVTAAKKLLYALAANSRALTLQGDPRTASFQSNIMGDLRSMSLNTAVTPIANQFSMQHPTMDPRAMSLTNGGQRVLQPMPLQYPQQQLHPFRGSPNMRHPHTFNGASGYVPGPGPVGGADIRQNPIYQLSGDFGSASNLSLPNRSNGSSERVANTSQYISPEARPQATPVGETFAIEGVDREASSEDQQSRVLKKINFNLESPAESPERLMIPGIDFSPEKPLKTVNRSPLKSIVSAVSSEHFNSKNENSEKIYSLTDSTTQNDVFVTASQFSLQNIEEENKSMAGDQTILVNNGSPAKINDKSINKSSIPGRVTKPTHSLMVSSDSTGSAHRGATKNKDKSFLKGPVFDKSKLNASLGSSPTRDRFVKPHEDNFEYGKPTVGRQIGEFSFGSESEVLRTAPLLYDDVPSSILSMDDLSSDENSVGQILNRKSTDKLSISKYSASEVQNIPGTLQNEESHKLIFTAEQLGIMQSNSTLLKELELVSNELVESISREFELDSRLELLLKKQQILIPNDDKLKQIRNQAAEIAKLISQLADERKKRYIAEEHVLRWENGVKPSILDLNYIQSEQEKKLMEQAEVIKEYQSKLQISTNENLELLRKAEVLQTDNNNLRGEVVPNLQNQITILENDNQYDELEDKIRSLKLSNEELRAQTDQIKSIENQKDALRDALRSMKENYERQLRLANDKIKRLEDQREKDERIQTGKSPLKLETDMDGREPQPNNPTRPITPLVD